MAECAYDFSYYEGKSCNYGVYGGYSSRRMKLARFFVYQKAISMIKKRKADGQSLDIGCAYGYLANFMSRHGFSASGCDISEYALGVASHMFPHVKTFRVDVDNGAVLPKDSYDLITAFEVLEHCRNLDVIAGKVHEALRPGGLFLISVPDSEMVPPEKQGDRTHVSFLNAGQWAETFSRAGLECVENSYFPFFLKRVKPYWGTNLILFRKPGL
jgi:2-polyprenyl-3-methyl-5-hydroxy-6-metoxy-1,4-benzoquinol methylase